MVVFERIEKMRNFKKRKEGLNFLPCLLV